MSSTRILIVHPDPSIAALMTSMLQSLGHRIDDAPNDRMAVRMLEHAPADLVLAAADPEDPDSLEFLALLRRRYPLSPVILVFPAGHPERAREAQLRGALAVLRFPLSANALRATVAQALGEPEAAPARHHSLKCGHFNGNSLDNGHNNGYAKGNGTLQSTPRFTIEPDAPPIVRGVATAIGQVGTTIGDDPVFRQALELARTIAPTEAPVMIVGERGVGKSTLARIIHEKSTRSAGPFVEACCSHLKQADLDVELFGRRNGGYAVPDLRGKVELARGGTLFLDNVSALTPDLQGKLLQLLRDGLTEPVGAGTPERADVRVLMGSREELVKLVPDGRFRQDLYYRMGVITLKLPPLRHRGTDLDRLAEHFRSHHAFVLARDVQSFSPEALKMIRTHGWPGNVHELDQAIERAVLVCRGQRIELNHLALNSREVNAVVGRTTSRIQAPTSQSGDAILPLKEALEGPERQLIFEALEALNWNRQETARVLDINRTTLYKKMKKYGLLFEETAWAN